MRFLSIEQKKYLPYTHTGTKYLKIEFQEKVTAFLANNGFGKSSLLRSLTPYPEVRTDYVKDGYCKKVVEHEGHIYELISDFKNTTKAHQFLKDGENLNISGATETQIELCNEFFGFSPLMDSLLSGKFKVSRMTKSERKQLFISTYPHEMSFILDYHKQVCSHIRMFNNNLKMLHTRKNDIESKLLSKEQLDQLYDFRKGLLQLDEDIDKLHMLISQDMNRYKNDANYDECRNSIALNPYEDEAEFIKKKCKDFKEVIWQIRRAHPELDDKFEITEALLTQKVSRLEEKISSLGENINKMRSSLSEYEKYKDLNVDLELQQIETKTRELNNALQSIVYNAEIPTIHPDKLSHADEDLETLKSYAIELHNNGGHLLLRAEIQRLQGECDILVRQIQNNRRSLEEVERQLDIVEKRGMNEQSYQYPETCALSCKLKASVQKMHERTKQDLDRWTSEKRNLTASIEADQKELIRLQESLQYPTTAMPKIEHIWDILQAYSFGKWVLNDLTLIDVLNQDPFRISNNFSMIIDNTRTLVQMKDIEKELHMLNMKTTALNTARQATKELQLISSTIYEKQTELERMISELSSSEDELISSKNQLSDVKQLVDVEKKLQLFKEQCALQSKTRWYRARIQFDSQILSKYEDIGEQVSTKLREIETTIREQENLLTRLNDEIKPNIKQIKEDLDDWSAVEAGLSPSTGAPHVYLVRYINRLINKVNDYISKVWAYDLELVYLKEDQPLDYSIQVMINKSSLLKDMNMLSDGQAAMVDLAFTLAIAVDRDFASRFPIKMDEVDPALSEHHRLKLTSMISNWVDEGKISQLFLVNHFVVHTGMANCEAVCLSTEGIVVPSVYNQKTTIR